ncbi:MAG: TonB-dependent receptor [Nitrospiraceae bacterium]|nr:TonB-dependent receptor [Nitrospiraceae bacterium]
MAEKKWMLSLVFVSLLVSALNYADDVNAENKNSKIDLAQNATTKEELLLFYEEKDLIIATKKPTPLRKAPAIATVITAEEIRNMGARNLLDILKRIPGIGVGIADQPTMNSIEVRGIKTRNSEKVLIMIDGMRMNNLVLGEAMYTATDISVENIKRVEVIRGPGSALYGANAFIAVINIVTKTASDIKKAEITAGGGSYGTQHYNLQSGYDGDNLKIAGVFDYFSTKGAKSFIESDAQTLNDIAHGTHASMAPGYTSEWNRRYDTGINMSYGDLSIKGRLIEKKKGSFTGVAYALNDESYQEFKQFFIDLSYLIKANSNLDITARAYVNQINMNFYWEIFPEGYAGLFPDGLLGSPSTKNRTTGVELTGDYTIKNHTLTVGTVAEYAEQFGTKHFTNFNPNTYAPLGSFQDITSWGNWNKNVDRTILALYLQDIWKISNSISFTAGIRYDNYSDFGDTINPRLGFVWEFAEDLSLKLLYGTAFRTPTFTELYSINNPVEGGNPDLKPEKIKTYEVGIEYRFLQKFTSRINYFHNEIKDLIVLGEKPSPADPAPYINKNKAKVDGVETELIYNYSKNIYGYLNYTYQHPIDADTGKKLLAVPSHRANAGINFLILQHLNTNLNLNWVGERSRAAGDTRYPLPSTYTVDLTMILKRLYKDFEIRGSVYNIFDKEYKDPSPYPVKVQYDYPTNHRSFIFDLQYKF